MLRYGNALAPLLFWSDCCSEYGAGAFWDDIVLILLFVYEFAFDLLRAQPLHGDKFWIFCVVWFPCIFDIVSRLEDRLLIACICAEVYWLLSCFGKIVLIMWFSELILWRCLLLIRNLPFYLLICFVPSNYRGINNENFCRLVSLYIWFGVEVEVDILMVSIYA